MEPAFGEDQRLHRLIRSLRKRVRPMAAQLQPLPSLQRVPRQMFIASLAADAKLRAQLRDRETVGLREYNESINLFHNGPWRVEPCRSQRAGRIGL